MSVDDPVASLALADTASRRLAVRARWVQRYYLLQAAYWFTAVLLFGSILPSSVGGYGGVVGMLVLLGLISAVDVWAQRKGVVVRGSRLLRGLWIGATLPLYLGTLILGLNLFHGGPTYWAASAVLVTAPSLAAAVVAGRAADPR